MPPERGRPTDTLHRRAAKRREPLYELGVFLFLIVPSMVISFFVVQRGTLTFPLVAASVMLRDLALVALVLFFLWRNGESFVRLGWTSREWWREALLGAALFPLLFWGAEFLDRIFVRVGLSSPAAPGFVTPAGAEQLILGVVLVIVVAVAEETLFRGYLILRLRALTGSPVAAVVVSSVVFSLGHGYEGTAGVATVGCLGAVFAIVYIWRGSLVAPVVLHFLQDFTSIVLPRLLGPH